jgi:hypothetical protein
MKKITTIFKLSVWVAVMVLNALAASAQRTSGAQQSSSQLSIGGNTVSIENVGVAAVLGPDNKIQHTANFDITLSDNEDTKAILVSLQSYFKKSSAAELFISTLNFNGVVQEERYYKDAVITEMQLPQLDAAAKSVLKIKIKIKAANVKLTAGGGKAIGKIGNKIRPAMASNFRIKMGNLPVNRVSKISAMNITGADNLLQNFSLDLAAIDGAAWNTWFLTGAGGIKKEEGVIELLTPDLKTVIFSIILSEVEITSYASSSVAGQVAKANIGLRAKGIAIQF